MRMAPSFVLIGVLLGSMIVALFGFVATAGWKLPASKAAAASGVPTEPIDAPMHVAVSSDELGIADLANSPAAQGECRVSAKFPEKVLRWCGLITYYANKRGLNPNLIAALILQESGGNSTAYSKSGAVGLMQVMPRDGLASSFMCKNGPCFSDRPSIQELENPEFNIAYGTKMLAGLNSRHGNLRDALKSYGPMNVGYYYADIVLGHFDRYKQ